MKLPSCQLPVADDGRELKNPNIIFTTCNYKALGSFPDGARQDRTGIAIAIEQMEKNRHGVKDIKGCDKLLMSDC